MKEVNIFYDDKGEIYCFPTSYKEIAESCMRFLSCFGDDSDTMKQELVNDATRHLQYYLRKVRLTRRANQTILYQFKSSLLNLYCLRNAFYKTPIPILEY